MERISTACVQTSATLPVRLVGLLVDTGVSSGLIFAAPGLYALSLGSRAAARILVERYDALLVGKAADLIRDDVAIVPDTIVRTASIVMRYAVILHAPRWKRKEMFE